MSVDCLKLLQWNMNSRGKRKGREAALAALLQSETPELALLQESGNPKSIKRILSQHGYQFESHVRRGLVSAFSGAAQVMGVAFGDYSLGLDLVLFRRAARLNVWNVHWPSRLHQELEDRRRKIVLEIERGIGVKLQAPDIRLGDIIAGDFNFEPFESTVTSRDGLYARRYLDWSRTKSSPVRRFNPCWTLLGKTSGDQVGTYRYSGSPTDGPHYVFDQVVFSGPIAVEDGPRVLPVPESRGSRVSDHNPLVTTLSVA